MVWKIPLYKQNPLRVAEKLGHSIAGSIGSEAMVELQLVYVLALLPKFSDNPKFRVVQHLLLYWPKAFYKSTLLWVFSETIPLDVGVVDITSMSRETIFGSVDKVGNPIKPAFADKLFVMVSELTAFLGSGWNMRDIANTMNVVMEGQPVARRLLKLVQADSPHVQRQVIELEKKGIHWNSEEGVMSYVPHVAIMAASRPLDNKYFTYLNQSGLLDRFHVLSHEFGDQELREDWHKHRRLNQEALKNLKEFNEKIKEVKVHDLQMPSEEFMKPIYDDLEAIVEDEITANPTLRKEEILNPRTKGDIIRELVAHAFIRTVCENRFQDIIRLEYTEADKEFVRQRLDHFIEFKVHPIFAEEVTERVPKRRPRDHAKSSILHFLKNGMERHFKDISAYLNQIGINVSQPTLYNALSDLIKQKKIVRTRLGFYKIRSEGNGKKK